MYHSIKYDTFSAFALDLARERRLGSWLVLEEARETIAHFSVPHLKNLI